nr:hypothetical protein [Clostridioides sp.]
MKAEEFEVGTILKNREGTFVQVVDADGENIFEFMETGETWTHIDGDWFDKVSEPLNESELLEVALDMLCMTRNQLSRVIQLDILRNL